MIREQAGRAPLDQLDAVNRFLNNWRYKEDFANYGRRDYWASPLEFFLRSGDCEDYAIAKYVTLRELGFSAEALRLVVVQDVVRDLAHAVLAVYLDDQVYILDNLTRAVAAAGRDGPVRALLLDQRDHALGPRHAGQDSGIVLGEQPHADRSIALAEAQLLTRPGPAGRCHGLSARAARCAAPAGSASADSPCTVFSPVRMSTSVVMPGMIGKGVPALSSMLSVVRTRIR